MDGPWLTRLQRSVKGIEVFGPKDSPPHHPYPGAWAVVGPTSEFSFSLDSADHAAMLFLAHYCGDIEAEAEAVGYHRPKRHAVKKRET